MPTRCDATRLTARLPLSSRIHAQGAACIFGAGQVYANAAGVLDKTGGEVANVQISVIQALVGGSAYLGTGEMSIVGESFARVGVTISQNGLGMTWFNGAGNMDLIYVPSFVTQVARAQFHLGAEVFLGSGWYTNVNNTRWSHQVVNAAMPGYEVGGDATCFRAGSDCSVWVGLVCACVPTTASVDPTGCICIPYH